jgi:hypothetical protein
MVATDETDCRDVVQQAGVSTMLSGRPWRSPRVSRALQQVRGGAETVAEEVHEGRLLRHRRQARIVAPSARARSDCRRHQLRAAFGGGLHVALGLML